MDHVSDSFLETNVPLLVLIEAARNGDEKEVKEYALVFREHANKLIEVGKKHTTEALMLILITIAYVCPVSRLDNLV